MKYNAVAVLIIGVTFVITSLQFFFPEILSEFRRNWDALRAGEWWRMVTPPFVQAYGWQQRCFNGITALFRLPLAEKFCGKRLFNGRSWIYHFSRKELQANCTNQGAGNR